MDKLEQARQQRKAERSLLRLQKRIIHNVSARFVTDRNDCDDGNGGQFVVVNEVGKRLIELDTFWTVIEAERNDGGFECRDKERGVLSKRRPRSVHFKFGVVKRSLALPLSLGGTSVKNNSWFLWDDEKDDKKRRAEMILKESMEYPQELMQL